MNQEYIICWIQYAIQICGHSDADTDMKNEEEWARSSFQGHIELIEKARCASSLYFSLFSIMVCFLFCAIYFAKSSFSSRKLPEFTSAIKLAVADQIVTTDNGSQNFHILIVLDLNHRWHKNWENGDNKVGFGTFSCPPW